MKSFVIKLAIFAALMFTVDFAFGKFFTCLQERAPYGNWQRFRYINDEMTDDVLIMGSSRASHHYVPSIIEDSLGMSCYNCGVDGNGILMFLANYRMFSKRYTPKVIIYDLSAFDLFPDDHSTYTGWLKAYSEREEVKRVFNDIEPLENIKLKSNLYKWNFKFIQLLTDNIAQFVRTEKGYKPLTGVMNYTPGKDKNTITDFNMSFEYDSLKIQYLEELILSCRAQGTHLVFAISPMYGATSSSQFEKVISMAKSRGCPVLDFYATKKYSTENKYFKDSSHMNHVGAEEYTNEIVKILKEYV